MGYRNDKRNAAIWLLEQLKYPKGYKITAIIENQVRDEVNTKTYSTYQLLDLIPNSPYPKEILRSAIELLYKNGHIAIAGENQKNVFEIEIRMTKDGNEALLEELYQLDIATYNNDLYFSYVRWWLPVLSLLLAIISLVVSTCKRSTESTPQTQPVQKESPEPLKSEKKLLGTPYEEQPGKGHKTLPTTDALNIGLGDSLKK